MTQTPTSLAEAATHSQLAVPEAFDARPTCAIYVRISHDPSGKELGVERQEKDCRAIAERKGWRVVRVYGDNDKSASKPEVVRADYDQMEKDHAAGLFTNLIMYALDRLTRQPDQLEAWIKRAAAGECYLVTLAGDLDLTTVPGQLVARILMAVAAAEVGTKAGRQKSAGRQRAEKGLSHASGWRATGYTLRGAVIEDEAALVEQMFARFLAGDSLKGIAHWLNSQGVPTPRNLRWGPNTVRCILMNPRYAGRVTYGGEVLEGVRATWHGLVSEADFDSVQLTLTDPERRSRGGVGVHRRHLGSGLFLCYACEHPVGSHSGDKYRCRQGEAHLTRAIGRIDAYVLAMAAHRLARPEMADAVQPPDKAEGARLRDAINGLRVRLVQTERDYDDDLIDARRYNAKKAKIEADLRLARAAQAKAVNHALAFVHDETLSPPQVLMDASLGMQRAIIDALVTVTLLPAPVGKRFNGPATVSLDWKV